MDKTRTRVKGFDVARALAIFGMVIVNFKVAMNADSQGNVALLWFASQFEGRASALFVMLAGIGITFLTRSARFQKDPDILNRHRYSLIKRGLLLITVGLAYTPIWPADILHFYGFYFLAAACLFTFQSRFLLRIASGIVLLFPLLMLLFDYEQGWDWNTLDYHGFWTLDGMVRHVLFNGFHPVIPWLAFLIFGMWLGRQKLTLIAVQKRMGLIGLIVWLLTEEIFFVLRSLLSRDTQSGLTTEEIDFLLSTSLMPPLPQYMLAAGSLSVVIIVACLYLCNRFYSSRFLDWLSQTGRLSLTLYVAHVIVGMGLLEALGYLENQGIGFALIYSALFCMACVGFSVFWLRHFKSGPMEWVFRRCVN